MLKLLKKYGVWLAILSIPLWNIFNMIFAPMGIAEEESVATGTVILFYIGLYIGHNISVMYFKEAQEISQKTALRGTLGVVAVILIWVGMIRYSRHSLYESANAFLIIFLAFILAISLALTGTAFHLVSRNKVRATESMALISQSELQLLQSQLSPHFLFNTLNNLYGLSLAKDDKLPGLLLKLSDLLRHSVYRSSGTFVPLNEELSYIKNYVEFERIRLEDRIVLSINLEESPVMNIAPMLLIVFVENAFKHSRNTTDQLIRIIINLKVWEDRILFSVLNSFDSSANTKNSLNKNSGLGLENAQRRLALLYPDKHELNIEETSNTYKVTLQLKTA